jgi:molecular chaperone GrpE
MQQELEIMTQQSRYHLDQWKRAAADLANYRKRVEKERGEWLQTGQAALASTLLGVLDDLERAFQTVPVPLASFTWLDGVALIERKLGAILEQQGLTEIEALGKPFDPALHQAVMHEATTAHPDGHVAAVLQKGYVFHNRVLRPALVKVAQNQTTGQADTAQADQTTDTTASK